MIWYEVGTLYCMANCVVITNTWEAQARQLSVCSIKVSEHIAGMYVRQGVCGKCCVK